MTNATKQKSTAKDSETKKTKTASSKTTKKPNTDTNKSQNSKSSSTTVAFQAQVKQILDLVVHSLYSQKEIFLRELVSNSYDAIEKRRLLALQNQKLESEEPGEIWLKVDKDAKTLSISDNGLGMSFDEVKANIGTIAHSGTKHFLSNINKIKQNPELIGQFGVGFYSSFMVAEKVTLKTKKVGEKSATLWQSTGDGTYTIDKTTKKDYGTEITLKLKVFDQSEQVEDFSDEWTIKNIIKKYSDFLSVPIKMMVTEQKPELDSQGKAIEGKTKSVLEEQTLNSQKALWQKQAKDITPEQYNEFYKSTCKDWTDPSEVIHYKAEGTQEFKALLFIPSNVPFDYNQRETKYGPSLYIKRVFISDNVKELLPPYLRFVKGIVDSDDIPLNVSREILQKDHRLKSLSKALLFKVLKHFEKLLTSDRDKYQKIWNVWGQTIKEGLALDMQNKAKLEKISLFKTSLDDRLTTLDEYISRMAKDQKSIYYLCGESIQQLKSSPHMEKIKSKNYEVLLLTDPVDEWVTQNLSKYNEKDILNIAHDNLDIDEHDGSETQKQKFEENLKIHNEKYQSLLKLINDTLSEHIKEVKLSTRLVDSPVCLVSGKFDPSLRMERLMAPMSQSVTPKAKRILEVNPEHRVIQKMNLLSQEKQKQWAHILYGQSLLNEGSQLDNPSDFSKKITELMSN